MQSPAFTTRSIFILLITVFLLIQLPCANPVAPYPIKRLSYQDSTHWVIAFDLSELGFYDKIPSETDKITLGCAQSFGDNTRMQQCVLPIKINPDSATGCFSSMHFPGLKLRPRFTVIMGISGDDYPATGPILPENLKPNTTFTFTITRTTCSEFIPPDYLRSYECNQREYVVTECAAYTRGTGRIHGILTDRRNKPLPSFAVVCFNNLQMQPLATAQTNSGGVFELGGLDLCPPHTLQFIYNNYKVDCTVEPLNNGGKQVADLSIRIEYPPVGIVQQENIPSDKSSAVRILASSGRYGNPVIVSVSDTSLFGTGVCELFTLGGKKVLSQPFICRGAGTYSIPWEGTDAPGISASPATYLCRIKIGSELWCKSIIKQ